MTTTSDEKRRPFNCFFSPGNSGHIRRIGWVIKTLEAQVGQFLLDCRCPVSWGLFMQEQDTLGEFPAMFFLKNVLWLHQQRWVRLRVLGTITWTHCIWQTQIPRIAAALTSPQFCTKSQLSCPWTSAETCPYSLFRVTCFWIYVSY